VVVAGMAQSEKRRVLTKEVFHLHPMVGILDGEHRRKKGCPPQSPDKVITGQHECPVLSRGFGTWEGEEKKLGKKLVGPSAPSRGVGEKNPRIKKA